MENNKSDESVKAGLEIAAGTKPTGEENIPNPLTENEKDLDEVVHEHSTEGNIENVEGENDVDDLVHKKPVAPVDDAGNKEQDIDDLMHRK